MASVTRRLHHNVRLAFFLLCGLIQGVSLSCSCSDSLEFCMQKSKGFAEHFPKGGIVSGILTLIFGLNDRSKIMYIFWQWLIGKQRPPDFPENKL